MNERGEERKMVNKPRDRVCTNQGRRSQAVGFVFQCRWPDATGLKEGVFVDLQKYLAEGLVLSPKLYLCI